MLRRLLIGLVLGLIVGGAAAALLVAGLGVNTFSRLGGGVFAYAAAALTGVLTGLVAGRPIWSSGAKIEAGLKAFFGAAVGLGILFALRQWAGGWEIDFPLVGAHGPTPIPDMPAVALPIVAMVLGAFFELDNTGENARADGESARAPTNVRSGRDALRVAQDGARKSRPVELAERDGDEAPELAGRAKH